MAETEETNEEIVVEDNQVICALTDQVKPAKSKELTLQSLIAMLNEEYLNLHSSFENIRRVSFR